MSLKFTSFNFLPFDSTHSARPASDATDADDAGLHASVSERVITAVAVTLAILFVSTVAVLMGMA
jgi:3-deoxy-D-manno-octulosonic acid (KDO) 8-phosphate synthase